MIALHMGKYRNYPGSSQFKNHALRFWDPGTGPQFQQQVAAAIECSKFASLNIFYQSRFEQNPVAGKQAKWNTTTIKRILHITDTSLNLQGRAPRKLVIVMGCSNCSVDSFLHQSPSQRQGFLERVRPIIDAW